MNGQKTILVIDDERDLVQMLRDLLTREGFRVITAYNGEEGIQKLKSTIPHLIILDINMPKMGGIMFYRAISNPRNGKAKYPVLVLTARANLEEIFKGLQVDGFMSKPFEIDDFLKLVGEILSKNQDVPAANSENPKKVVHAPKKVLIVEDQPDSFNRLVAAFSNAGYMVSGVKTGVLALERIAVDLPDLVVTKTELKDFSADILAAKIRQVATNREIPVLIYTSGSNPEEDANFFFPKSGTIRLIDSDDAAKLLAESECLLREANGG